MIDHEKIEQAVRLLLEGIGEDVNREGLLETPDRIARMYEEIYGGMEEDAGIHLSKTFTVESREMVIEKDITFYSTCEHHLLPFYGKAALVMIEAEHMCMTMRGIKKPGSQTVTLARRGVFETDPSLEERFFRMLGR